MVVPDVVCLELDSGRLRTMREGGHFPYSDGERQEYGLEGLVRSLRFLKGVVDMRKGKLTGLGGKGNKGVGGVKINGGGGVGAALAIIQEIVGKEAGVVPGSEMLTAYKVANEYGLKVVPIDIPIDIILSRLWGEMGISEKIRLLCHLVSGFIILLLYLFGRRVHAVSGIGIGDIEEVIEKREDLVEDLRKKFPTLHRVLINERNKYMAHRIIECLNKGERVVAVVGAGHIKGIKEHLSDWGVEVEEII